MKGGCLTIIAVIAGAIFLLWLSHPTVSWNQKLTLNIETPSGPVSASSVTAVAKVEQIAFPGPEAGGVTSELKGEAVVVDMGNGKYLFALLTEIDHLAQKVFRPESGLSSKPAVQWPDWAKNMKRLSGKRDLSLQQYPPLVAFGNINDPASVKKVNPNNLAAMFGSGYSLKSITFEITDEPVTEGKVESVLGWLEELNNTQLDGDRYHRADATNQWLIP